MLTKTRQNTSAIETVWEKHPDKRILFCPADGPWPMSHGPHSNIVSALSAVFSSAAYFIFNLFQEINFISNIFITSPDTYLCVIFAVINCKLDVKNAGVST